MIKVILCGLMVALSHHTMAQTAQQQRQRSSGDYLHEDMPG